MKKSQGKKLIGLVILTRIGMGNDRRSFVTDGSQTNKILFRARNLYKDTGFKSSGDVELGRLC